MKNCIVWGNTNPAVAGDVIITRSDIQSGWPGEGNIDADPLLFDPDNGDFHLSQDPCQPGVINPCVDTGEGTMYGTTRTDRVEDQDPADMGYHYLLPRTLRVPAEYPTIQSAIDWALNGDTVLVSPGTYPENIDFLGKSIMVRGDAGLESTEIDGMRLGSVVTMTSGEDGSTCLQGFTLTNGNATYGGGLFIENGSSPLIRGNRIEENTAFAGGGVWLHAGASPVIDGNVIGSNSADGGSGGGLSYWSFGAASSPPPSRCRRAGSRCLRPRLSRPCGCVVGIKLT